MNGNTSNTNPTLSLISNENKTITFASRISGTDNGYNINIDGKGTVKLDSYVKNANVTVNGNLLLSNNSNINKANSQLIFTTHATNLLNLEILRRDQIWFTEKNPYNGASELYPLDSFSVRKDENIEKGYINGRYGAIQFIKDIDIWQEDK